MSRTSWLVVSLLSLAALVLAPSSAAADDAHPPEWRFDVMLPRLGAVHVERTTGTDQGGATAELELRLAHASGHGVLVRSGLSLGGTDYYPLLDADYLYRIDLVGDARLGLALDASAGVSVGDGNDCVGWFGCTDGAAVDGLRAGGNVGATLVFHAYGFTVDVDVRYRLLAPTGAPDAQEISEPEHLLSAGLGLGFGFW